MLPGYILSVREGLEAALIVGIVLGAVQKMSRPDLRPLVWRGVIAAATASMVIGLALNLLGTEFKGRGEMLFEGASMVISASLLTWMIFWMGRQNRRVQQTLEAGVRKAALQANKPALFMLAFVSVLREGTELAFFLFAANLGASGPPAFPIALLGLASAGALGWLLFRTTRRLNLRNFFRVTNVLLMFFAAGLVSRGAHEFIELGWLPGGIAQVWDANFLLNEKSIPGQVANVLFGYTGAPSLTEVLSYAGYFVLLWIGFRLTLNSAPASRIDAA